MHKRKISYIVQSSIGVGIWTVLTVIASIKFVSAEQLSLVTKLVILGFLWALVIHIVYVLIQYYKKLDAYDLDSKNNAPWSSRKK